MFHYPMSNIIFIHFKVTSSVPPLGVDEPSTPSVRSYYSQLDNFLLTLNNFTWSQTPIILCEVNLFYRVCTRTSTLYRVMCNIPIKSYRYPSSPIVSPSSIPVLTLCPY